MFTPFHLRYGMVYKYFYAFRERGTPVLQLKNIKKDYLSGDETVHALKGIDISFRENEFVSILGQSGCGKTTLLTIRQEIL